MARLPQPGGDDGNWGNILNDYLSQSLKSDGTLQDNAVTANNLAPNSVTNSALANDAVNAAIIADGTITNVLIADTTIQEAKLSSAVQTKLNAAGGSTDWIDITNKPTIIAAGADQAAARSVIGAGTSNLTLGTSSGTAKAGDYQPTAANISDSTTVGRSLLTATDASAAKTVLSLTKSDVGLGNVDNTSDAAKNEAAVTLTNKTLSDPKISSIKDVNGNPSLDLGAIPNAVNRIYIDNQSTGNYPTLGATGPDTNIGIALAPKNDGPINVFGNAPTIAAAGGANGGNLNLNLKSQPVSTSKMMYPFYSRQDWFEPWPQLMCQGGNWSLASGDMPMTLFIPAVDMTVSNIITMGWNDTTQTDATACRVAIYIVNDITVWPADMTCIARSGHKADRWNGSVLDTAPIVDDGAVSPSIISSVQLTAGQQYAVGFMSVGHTGTPKLSALGTFRNSTLQPHIGFFGDGGYSDIPTHLTGGWLEEWTFVWFALS
jgi:hypothetical protein